MPSIVATALCLLFIIFLLYRNSILDPAHSWGLWVANIWVALLLSRPVTYWFGAGFNRESELDAYLDGSPIERNVLLALISAGLFVLLRRRVNWKAVFTDYPVVWLFYAFFAISVMWAPYPLVASKRLIRDLGNVIMILIVLTEHQRLEAIKRVFVRSAIVLVPLSVLFIKYYPEIGRYYHRWTYQVQYSGITTNKNSLGLLAMIAGLFLLWHIFDSRRGETKWQRMRSMWPECTVVMLCVWLLSIANSATALACSILGVLVYTATQTSFKGISAKASAAAIVFVGVAGWVALQTSFLRGVIAQSVGRNETLTERTDIWAAALDLPTNLLIGAGFSSVWLTPAGWALRERIGGLAHAHNGYLEVYLNGGLVGLGLLIGIVVLSAIQAGRHLAGMTAAGPIFVAVVTAGIVYNYTEVTFNTGNAVGLLFWLIALCPPGRSLLSGPKPETAVKGTRSVPIRTPPLRRRSGRPLGASTRPPGESSRQMNFARRISLHG